VARLNSQIDGASFPQNSLQNSAQFWAFLPSYLLKSINAGYFNLAQQISEQFNKRFTET
jgi:hypothetical protein